MKRVFIKTNKELEKTKRSKSLLAGSIIALLIAISPYIFYSYQGLPDKPVWETFLFTFESKYQGSVYISGWFLIQKIVPLILLILWFFTCKHWWYHVILIPVAMYCFQIFSTLNDDIQYYDEVEIYYLLPIMLIVIPFVYLIRIKLFDKLVHGIDLKAIERELDEYKEKERLERIKKEEERKKRMSDIH
ncbi:hypothetical protein GTQ40_06060 [Flavobacteriaceae bacterium R38]|nr:hypothetical protein [Flavobacteriaceae bacterium R38]